MACLRCGSKTAERQAFCDACLENMHRHPVKPGTAIHLPQRETVRPEKKPPVRHREPTPSEQIDRLRKMIRWLSGILALLAVLLMITAGMLLHTLQKETPLENIGRNYTTSGVETRP